MAFQCVYGCCDGRSKNEDKENGKKWRFTGLLYIDNLVLYVKWMVVRFIEVCRKDLKINANNSKTCVMMNVARDKGKAESEAKVIKESRDS